MRKMTAVIGVGVIALTASVGPAVARQTSESPFSRTPAAEPLPRRGFSVVLLLGDTQGADAQDAIPAAARKALSDMRDFLPYKSYRLLDTQWIIGGTSGPALTRLRGAEDQEYELELRASPMMMPGTAQLDRHALSVRFVLRDSTVGGAGPMKLEVEQQKESAAQLLGAEVRREIFQLEQERDELSLEVNRGRAQVEVGTRDPDDVKRLATRLEGVTRRINELKKSMDAAPLRTGGRPVIDTSFKMEDGETVVVGTSRVKGTRALIALLTATSDRPKTPSK